MNSYPSLWTVWLEANEAWQWRALLGKTRLGKRALLATRDYSPRQTNHLPAKDTRDQCPKPENRRGPKTTAFAGSLFALVKRICDT